MDTKKIISIALGAFMLTGAFAEKQNLSIKGSVGNLSAVIQKPESAAKKIPLVMVLHGFTSSKDDPVVVSVADELEKRGIASVRFDFNGHGESEGDFVNMTVLNEIEDAKAVYDYVSKLDWVSSVSIAGHSQGGVVASMTAGELGAKKVKSLVLLAPAAVLREDAIRGYLMGITYDPVNTPEYVEIFYGLHLGRNYIKTAQTLKIYETAQKYTGPVCIIHGTGDVVVPYTFGERYDSVYKNSELHLIEGDDHVFSKNLQTVAETAADFIKSKTK